MKCHHPVIIMNKNICQTNMEQSDNTFIMFSLNEIGMREYMILLIIIVGSHVLTSLGAMSIHDGHFFQRSLVIFLSLLAVAAAATVKAEATVRKKLSVWEMKWMQIRKIFSWYDQRTFTYRTTTE